MSESAPPKRQRLDDGNSSDGSISGFAAPKTSRSRGGGGGGGGRGGRGGGGRGNGGSRGGRGGRGGQRSGSASSGSFRPSAAMDTEMDDDYTEVSISKRSARNPFASWTAYLPNVAYSPTSEIGQFVHRGISHYRINPSDYTVVESGTVPIVVCINYEKTLKAFAPDGGTQGDQKFTKLFESALQAQAENYIKALCIVFHEILLHNTAVPESAASNNESITAVQVSNTKSQSLLTAATPFAAVVVRVLHITPTTPLRDFKANMIGRLVSVRGTVVRTSSIKPLLTRVAFRCASCGGRQTVTLTDGRFVYPTRCSTIGCRCKQFNPERGTNTASGSNASLDTRTIDWQQIRIQEKLADSREEAGRVPRTVDCELANDLVDTVVPGDVVTVSGIIKVLQTPDSRAAGGNSAQSTNAMYVLYIDAVSIQKLGGGSSDNGNGGNNNGSNVNGSKFDKRKYSNNDNDDDDDERKQRINTKDAIFFTPNDLAFIRDIVQEPDLLRLIVHSLCPSIYGHDLVKCGILLGLFGARRRNIQSGNNNNSNNSSGGSNGNSSGGSNGINDSVNNNNKNGHSNSNNSSNNSHGNRNSNNNNPASNNNSNNGKMNIRSDPHVLIVGDPGLGKSQLLGTAIAVAPRGVYVCGSSGITTGGLTVSLHRESGSKGDFALEAGALVLADQGVCGIDEFDKMSSDYSALLEAMEQQQISIAKGGLVASLPARTSVIAAANPVGGHYNRSKTVSENLRLNSALLSRFDLVFLLLDRPDANMDAFLTDHLLAMHTGLSRTSIVRAPPSLLASSMASGPLHAGQTQSPVSGNNNNNNSSNNNNNGRMSLRDRLPLKPGEQFDSVPHPLLRKYIAYARKYVHPRLTGEAAKTIQNFYLELRSKYRGENTTPITTRQLESLIRLSEARAKIELREEVTEDDAQDIIEIMQYNLTDTFAEDDDIMHNYSLNGVDLQRSQMGTGMSQRGEINRFAKALHQRANFKSSSMFSRAELHQVASEIGLHINNMSVMDVVDSMRNQNIILLKGNGQFQLCSAS
ncbi:MCM-domain-containing protein [Ramicandelaber brevisporus]|nr:MCM-domain-containing protein [Ramicandelaber brevisporus]